ncbi:PKD domain-containing protein, partial [Candidatus Bipolaricaulota bacterium]|nr:PKD domain-containing protein [Candidatus Bipolaricaulota bacterium]
MRRKVIGGLLLLSGILAWGVSAQVTFVDQDLAAGYLNPGDTDIVVQKVRLQNTADQPILFDVITVRNLGTATHQEITRIELRDGGGLIGAVNNPIGLASGGVAIAVDYTLPAGATVDIEVLVDVADVAQIDGGKTLVLEVQFHYFVGTTAYTSAWIPDGETEEIVKAGFEEIHETELPAGNYNPGDGVDNPVQQVTFTDNDANDSPITVTKIKVRNLGTAIAADDIASVKVTVRYDGVNYEETKVPDATDFNNGGLVFDPTTNFGAWNGNVADDSAIEIKVEIEVAGNPTDGRTVQTEIILELVEQQPGGDQGFTQTSQAPTVQTIRNAGIEEIEEQSTPPVSGVLNPGEILAQTIVVRDNDVNPDQPEITAIWIQNQGTATDAEIADITVKVNGTTIGQFPGGTFAEFATTGTWLNITDQLLNDDGTLTVQILYRIGNISPGHTLQPRVKIASLEPNDGVTNNDETNAYISPYVDFPVAAELRPAGFEYAEDVAQDSATVFTGQRFLAQKIRLDDQDENDDGVTINPVVIRNLGTAKASDITKIEVRNAAGDLLGETTDVAGFHTGGVTISTLQNNVVADDGSIELWIWVTIAAPEVAVAGRTIQLETTVHHLENGATYQATVASAAVFTIELNRRPVVNFDWTPENPKWSDNITFTPSVSDPDGDAIVWSQWDFGDGTDPITRDGPPQTVTHQYPDGGTFTVTLTVKDARGLTGTKSKQ